MRTITITIGEHGCPYEVIEDDKSTGRLNFDEMLSSVVHLAHPKLGVPPYAMRTAEEWEAYNKRWRTGTPATGGANPE